MRILYTVFLSLVAVVPSVFAQDDARASATWQVQRYDINASLPQTASDRNLTAKAVLTLKNASNSPASTVTLRISSNATISAVGVNGGTADFLKREEKLASGETLQRARSRALGCARRDAHGVRRLQAGSKGKQWVEFHFSHRLQFLPLSFWYPTPNSWYFARGADYAPFKFKVAAPAGQTIL